MDGEPTTSRAPTGRVAATAALGVVAVVGVVGAVVGSWVVSTATDSARFERRISDLVQREEISDALAERVVAETVAVIDVEEAAAALVPDSLGSLLQMALAGVRSRVEDRVAEMIRTPEVAATIGSAAGRAHAAVVETLEGDTPVAGVDDGAVRVDLLPLTGRTIEAFQEVGLFTEVDLPELVEGDPETRRRQLATALDRELPAGFGQPVLYRSERLDEVGTTVDLVRDVFLLTQRTFWLLALVGLAAAASSIWLSGSRLRAAAVLVAGVFGATLAVRMLVGRTVERLPDVVDQPGAKVAVREIAEELQHSLEQTMLWYSSVALLVFVGAAAALWWRPTR